MIRHPNTCPICGRTFNITPADDVLLPSCGHYGTDPFRGDIPCNYCGLQHAWDCPDVNWPSRPSP